MRNSPAFQYNIWMHIYADKYEELFSYSMKLVKDETVAEEMVRELSIAYFKNEKQLATELAKFPALCQQIFNLHFTEKKTVSQIAKELSLKYRQVKPRLDKSTALLRKRINPDFYRKMIERARKRNPALQFM